MRAPVVAHPYHFHEVADCIQVVGEELDPVAQHPVDQGLDHDPIGQEFFHVLLEPDEFRRSGC